VGLNLHPATLTQLAYDTAGSLHTVTHGSARAAFTYLANSPLVGQISFSHNGVQRMTTTRQLDSLNRLTRMATAGGTGFTLAAFAYPYNGANQRVRVDLAGGSFWIYKYDPLGQAIAGRKYWSDGTPAAGQQFEYGFDDIGNRTEVGGRGSAELVYTMNLSNQYTQWTVAGAIDVFGLADPQAAVQVNGAIQAGNNSAARHAFVPKNPEVLQYDDDGNLTQDGRWIYEWNGENRLIRMTARSDVPGPHYQVTFQYDWMGRRIRKTVVDADTGQTISDLIFLYDGWNLIAEVDAQTGELIGAYVWGLDLSGSFQGAGGIGGLLWVNVESGSHAGRYFAAYDGNGNVMGLVSASDGSLVAQYEYGPFAEPLRAVGPLAADNPFRFSTKYMDLETGLIYYGYRYYSPSLGR